MGYFNKLEMSIQDDVDRLVQWYRANADELPPYVLEWIIERDERLWPLVERWEKLPAEPKPASHHVALQSYTRRERRELDKASQVVQFAKSDYVVLIMAIIAFAITSIGALLWIARLV